MQLKVVFAGIALAAMANQGSAASLNLTDTVTYGSSGSVVTPGVGQTGPISPTVSFGISHAFNGAPIDSNFPSAVAGNGGPWNFYDDYVFTVGVGSNVQSALISFDQQFAGISNLQGRIISVNSPFAPLANLGAPASGNTLVDAWLNTTPVSGIYTVNLNQTAFGPGTYALQIRGEVAPASQSGGYGGTISFTPVPLPAALPLLLSGVALLSARARRKRELEVSEV